MWLLFCFLNIQELGFAQILFYEAFTDNSFITAQGIIIAKLDWTIVGGGGIYSTCGTTRLFGGYGTFGEKTKVTKLFQLPPHYSMQISFDFWKLDTWNNEQFFLYADQTLVFTDNYDSSGSGMCGYSGNNDQVFIVTETITHNFQSVFFFLTSDLDQDTTNESWGIRNFKLYLYLCPAGCQTCDSGDSRETCLPWIIVDSGLLRTTYDDFHMDGWTIEKGHKETTLCENVPLLGGYDTTGENSIIMKTINLPPHFIVKIKFRFVFLDTWNGEDGYFYVDGIQEWSQFYHYYSRKIQDLCGGEYDEILSNQAIQMIHSNSQINLIFSTDLDQNFQNESFGVRDFELFIYCKFGDSSDQTCGQICGDGVKQGKEICDDGNIYPFDGCFNCEYSCVEGCSNCIEGVCFECKGEWQFNQFLNTCSPDIQDNLITLNEECDDVLQINYCKNGLFNTPTNCQYYQFGLCYQCNNGYLLFENNCEPICSDLVLVNQIECQDDNLIAFDKCNQCQFDIQEGCLEIEKDICLACKMGWQYNRNQNQCIPICGNQIINGMEECDVEKTQLSTLQFGCTDCYFSCQDECTECSYGKCYQCITGWKVIQFKCVTICGDEIITGLEDCDDKNNIQMDGCYNCKNDCQSECTLCQRGKCLNCIYGWKLNNKGICVSECGDNKLALFSLEECDDGNYFSNDGCSSCKIECCAECSICVYGLCYECNYTFTLIEQFCLPVCGDGLITIGYENCDDMNDIPYDGCYLCEYQCRLHCKNCIKGICYDACSYGYVMIDYDCQTVCGDQIVAGYEECDDNNSIQFDGCYQCYYSCPIHCQTCNEGQCYQCDQGYVLFFIQNYCEPGCGDGKVAIGVEECDDGNNDNNDGCSSKCLIETDYVCKNTQYSFSECTYEKYPKFMATFVQQQYLYQYVSLTFTQKVKTITDDIFSNYIELQLSGVEPEFYSLKLLIIQEASDNVMDVSYMVEIQINQTLTEPPHLKVILHDYLYNSNDAHLRNLVDQVKLKFPKYMNDQQKQLAISLQNASQNMISSLGGLGIIVILLGNSFLLWGLVELLQQQSYLRFINVVFPENLFIYFEVSNIITLQPVIKFFHFDQITNVAIDTPFLESYAKLKFYEINADIISNLETQIFIIITMYFTYKASNIILKGIYSLRYFHFYELGFYISKAIYKVKNSIAIYLKELKKEGVKLMLISNSWDLFFISFIQIQATELVSIRSDFSLGLALMIIYIALFITSNYINNVSTRQLDFMNYWTERYPLFLTLKKIVFIAILVLFQLNQQIQTILLSSTSLMFLIYILIFRPVDDSSEYCKLIIMELTTFIFTTTQFFYWEGAQKIINYDKQILLGWFHISIQVSTLMTNIVLQLYLMIKLLISKLRKGRVNQRRVLEEQLSNPFPLKKVGELKV